MLAGWQKKPGQLSCEQCRALVDSYNLDNPDNPKEYNCDACEMPRPLSENYPVFHILRVYGAGIGNGMGGLLLSEVILACEMEEILPTLHFINKIMKYYQELTKREENGNQ